MNAMTDFPHLAQPDPALRQQVEQHLRGLLPELAPGPLGEHTALLGSGGLDSLGVVQLMVFLGTELGIDVLDEDFTEDNLGTLGQLLDFVSRKRAMGVGL